jgi:energy-coupling factor transport system permease protein
LHKVFGVSAGKDTFVYHLNPLIKFCFSFTFVIVAGFLYSILPILLITAIFLAAILMSGVGISGIPRMIRPFGILLIFTFIIQLFLTSSGTWTLPSLDSLQNTLIFTYRIIMMIAFSAIFAVITPPADIVRVFRFIFTPLKIFRINPNDVAMSMLITLRFIPMLFMEGEKILDSQRLKGMIPCKGEKGARLKTLRAIPSLIVPLFVRAFHYASQIAITLQYRGNDKDFFKLPRLSVKDFSAGVVIIAMAIGVFFARHVS